MKKPRKGLDMPKDSEQNTEDLKFNPQFYPQQSHTVPL